MDSNSLISELYQLGYINGKAFFFCVEQNISTVGDLELLSRDSFPSYCKDELLALLATDNSSDINILSDSSEQIAPSCYKQILDYYESLILEAGPRTQRLFDSIREQQGDYQFVQKLLSISDPTDFPDVYYVGKGTILRAIDIVKKIQTFATSNHVRTNDSQLSNNDELAIEANFSNNTNKSFVDSLEPIVLSQMQHLTVRSKNVLHKLLMQSGGSVSSLYSVVTNPDFKVKDLQNAGKKSWGEISAFIAWLRSTIESFERNKDGQEDISSVASNIREEELWKQFGFDQETSRELLDKHQKLGRIPVFSAIHHYIKSLEHKKRTIIQSLLLIYKEQNTVNRNELAKQLSLTSERVRQLTLSLLHNHIEKFVLRLRARWSDSLFEYDYHLPESINLEEGTTFSRNFIYWVITLLNDKFSIVGDIDHCFLNFHNRKPQIYIVPSKLNKVFNFDHFLELFDQIYHDKHTSDYECNISDLCFRCFRGRVIFEDIYEIISICKHMIELFYVCYFREGKVVIEQNAQLLIGDIIVALIEDAGKPLSADELFTAINEHYPGRITTIQSLTAYIQKDNRLLPMGRSGIYTLAKWCNEEHRGGTIREFAYEYLSSLPDPIATIEEIGQYVRKYRPDSSDSSIKANLLAESSGRYTTYYQKNTCYIGLSSYDHDPSFVPYTKEGRKRDFKISCTLLEQFLVNQNHFPFINKNDEDEMRLYRFWNIQKHKLSQGELDDKEASIVKSILTRFDDLPRTKSEYLWLKTFDRVITGIKEIGLSFIRREYQWIYGAIREYQLGSLEEWKKPKVQLLIKTIEDAKRL